MIKTVAFSIAVAAAVIYFLFGGLPAYPYAEHAKERLIHLQGLILCTGEKQECINGILESKRQWLSMRAPHRGATLKQKVADCHDIGIKFIERKAEIADVMKAYQEASAALKEYER